jgi:group I intron endonuclease
MSHDHRCETDRGLCQIALDLAGYPHEEDSWYYSIGCMLGNLSVRVFPATAEEYQQWEAEYRSCQEWYDIEQTRMHDCGIYCITSLDTGKQYVGRSTDLKTRLRLHRYDSVNHPEYSPKLYTDIQTYGIERFQVDLPEECPQSELASRERYWLDALGTEYNGYNFLRKDFKHTDENKQRFSWLRKGRVLSAEHRQNIAQARTGRKHSNETLKALQRAGRKQSRLSEQDVRNIKKLMQERVSPSEIMNLYNIGRGTYYDIKYGKSWRDVQAEE